MLISVAGLFRFRQGSGCSVRRCTLDFPTPDFYAGNQIRLTISSKRNPDAARRGEEVVITFYGKPYAITVPPDAQVSMWKDRTDKGRASGGTPAGPV